MVRRQVRRDLWGQGLGRHSREELDALTLPAWGAISGLLGDRLYLMGDCPSSVDASLYGLIVNVLAPGTPIHQAEQVRSFPNLVDYQARMQERVGAGILGL